MVSLVLVMADALNLAAGSTVIFMAGVVSASQTPLVTMALYQVSCDKFPVAKVLFVAPEMLENPVVALSVERCH